MPDSSLTKRALAQTMKELMARESFSKISVGEICEACGMSRKSFYYHFRDKYDLVNWIFDTEFIEVIQKCGFASGADILNGMCGYFYKERGFYRSALEIEGQNSFRDHFTEVITPLMYSVAREIFSDREDEEFFTAFFSDAILASIVRWLTKGTPMPAEEYVARLRNLAEGLSRLELWHGGAPENH